MNDKKELETEQGEDHKKMWSMIRTTEKYEWGEEHKIKGWMMRKTEKLNKGKNTK